MLTGRCECGAVSFEIGDVEPSVTACHCSQCRRFSGHVWASVHADYKNVTFITQDGLVWYASSDWAKRGFCSQCGSSLFYRMNDADGIGIAAGCLDMPTGMKISKHIFVGSKGDYYDITDDVPQIETY